jgi:hypothetical protein
MRRYAWSVTFVYLLLGAATFLFKVGPTYSRGVLLLAWFFGLLVVPPAALPPRYLVSRLSWWGEKTVVLGGGLRGTLAQRPLRGQRGYLAPVPGTGSAPRYLEKVPGTVVENAWPERLL